MQINIRPYRDSDRSTCLNILVENTPPYFAPDEEEVFARFLDELPGPYFVAETDGSPVGCGGWEIPSEQHAAVLTWGMVSPSLHGRGIGTKLLRYRIDALRRYGILSIHLSTTQLASAFFERQGFVALEVVPSGYGPSLDRIEMQLALSNE